MSWRLVALKDVGDAMRQYNLHVCVGLVVVLFGTSTYLATGPEQTVEPDTVPWALAGIGTFLLPLLAIGFSYGTVVTMRTRGDLKLLLGMPFSRRDVVLGSFLGRSVLVAASVVAGVGVAALVALLRGAPLALDALLVVAGLLSVLGIVFVAISVAASASVSTETRASALVMGSYFLFVFELWGQLPGALVWLANGFSVPEQLPQWADVLAHLNPVMAFRDAARPVIQVDLLFGAPLPDAVPIYRTLPAAVLLLALWILVPLVLGYRRFAGTDL